MKPSIGTVFLGVCVSLCSSSLTGAPVPPGPPDLELMPEGVTIEPGSLLWVRLTLVNRDRDEVQVWGGLGILAAEDSIEVKRPDAMEYFRVRVYPGSFA